MNVWHQHVIESIRKFTKKEIRIRFHPGDKMSSQWASLVRQWINTGQNQYRNIVISGAKELRDEFVHAQAVVGHNSSPTVASVIEGIPTLVTDPLKAQIKGVNLEKWEDLENPKEFDREIWIRKKAQTHWTLDEVKSGLAWQHLRKYIK